MKVFLFLATMCCAAAIVSVTVPAPPVKADHIDVEIDFDYFHERLLPNGHWVEVEDYGMCWYPAETDDDWCPYDDGHWVYIEDYGWYWDSDEDFAWACYHYGRWHHHDRHGWVWVPGYEWGPAWVSWRRGGGYCAWAPLPPRATFEVNVGVRIGGGWERDIRDDDWVCVNETNFTNARVHDVRVRNNVTIINNTTIIGAVSVQNNVVVNNTIQVNDVERNTGRKVERKQVREASTLGDAKVTTESSSEVKVFKPRVKQGSRVTKRDDNDEGARQAKLKTVREKHEAERQEIAVREPDPKRREEREREVRKVQEQEERNVSEKPVRRERKPAETRQSAPQRRAETPREEPRKEPAKEPRKEPPAKEPPPRKDPPKEPPIEEPPRKEPPIKEPPRREPPRKEPQKKEPPRKETPPKRPPSKEDERERQRERERGRG